MMPAIYRATQERFPIAEGDVLPSGVLGILTQPLVKDKTLGSTSK